MWAPGQGPAHICSVPLRDVLFFAGSFGPSNGHPIGYPCGHPMGTHFSKQINILLSGHPRDPGGIEPQPIKLEFTIYPAELWI